MPQGRPGLLFPDASEWMISYLEGRLSGRAEPYAAHVLVAGDAPDEELTNLWPASGRVVTVRDDGGSRDGFRQFSRLGFNVWTARGAAADAHDLSGLVAALVDDSPGFGRVVGVVSTSVPIEVPDSSGRPHRYFTAELVFTGSALTA